MEALNIIKNYWFCVLFFIVTTSIKSQNKAFFGTTSVGGKDDLGVIFKTDTNGENQEVIYNFEYKNKGRNPENSRLCEVNGKFYGTTINGGANNSGVLYEYNPSNKEYSKLVDFDGTDLGRNPYSNVIAASNGKLYGTTLYGGVNDLGVLFEYDLTTKTITKKIDFDGDNNGSRPYHGVIQALNGKLYGITNAGGVYGYGVLFEYNLLNESLTKLLDFDDTTMGRTPSSLIQAADGALYGLASSGGANAKGTIFKFDLNTSLFTKLLDFDGVNGATPYLSLMQASNGKLYGMTASGGVNSFGVIFEYNLGTQTYTKKFDFDGNNLGYSPKGDLIEINNKLYGLTFSGGINGKGVIFEYDFNTNTCVKKFDFNGLESGSNPNGSFMKASNGKLYATTRAGGSNSVGTLFEYNTETEVFNRIFSFNGTTEGYSPQSNFVQAPNGKLYTTLFGGKYGTGVLIEMNPMANSVKKVYDFDILNSLGSIKSSLILASNDKLYGVTGQGKLFDFDTNTYTLNFLFTISSSTLGYTPVGIIEASNGNLYGMTTSGGANNKGVLFKYDIIDNSYSVLLDLDGTTTGARPFGNLVEASNNKLYGMTSQGGANNYGVVFEYDIALNTLIKKHDFLGGVFGNGPRGSLIEASNNKLYGVAYGGASNGGILFEYDYNSNAFTKKIDFDGTNTGSYPNDISLSSNDGKLYGVTDYGGENNRGVLFEYNIDANSLLSKFSFNDFNTYSANGIMEACIYSNFYADVDGDGFGDPNTLIQDCVAPTNYVLDNTDCNDGLGSVYPGAPDINDGIQNDCTTLSVNDFSFQNISIYPNPVNSVLNIKNPDSMAYEITILNLLGQNIHKTKNIKGDYVINLSALKQGIYLLNINSSSKSQTIKFIKN